MSETPEREQGYDPEQDPDTDPPATQQIVDDDDERDQAEGE